MKASNQISLKRFIQMFVILAMLFVLGSMALFQYALSVGPGEQSEQWFSPEQEGTYIVGPYSPAYFFAENHTGYGFDAYQGYELLLTNDTEVLQYCVNLTSAAGGGKVFVKSGSYAAIVTVKDKVHLVIEKGAATVTVSIGAGASCTVEDWNVETLKHYESGTLIYSEDHKNGNVVTTWLNGTNLVGNYLYLGSLTSDPISPNVGEMWYRSDLCQYRGYNGTVINLGSGSTGPAGPAGGVARMPFTYLVFRNTTSTYMMDKTGTVVGSNNDNDTVINWALGNLTAGRATYEEVDVQSDPEMIINNPITPASWTYLHTDGSVKLASGSNCNMIQNANPSTEDHSVIIDGGQWDGNDAGNSAGDVIYWIQGTDCADYLDISREIMIKNVYITDVPVDGICVNSASGGGQPYILDMYNDKVVNSGRYALSLTACSDFVIDGCTLLSNSATATAIYLYNSGTAVMSNTYSNCWDLVEVRGMTFTDFFLDIPANSAPGITVEACSHNTFTGGKIHCFGGASTYSGISLVADGSSWWEQCQFNSFVNIDIGPQQGDGTNKFAYGILDSSTSANLDYNTFSMITARSPVTAGIRITGSNTYVSDSWNSTVRITTAVHGP